MNRCAMRGTTRTTTSRCFKTLLSSSTITRTTTISSPPLRLSQGTSRNAIFSFYRSSLPSGFVTTPLCHFSSNDKTDITTDQNDSEVVNLDIDRLQALEKEAIPVEDFNNILSTTTLQNPTTLLHTLSSSTTTTPTAGHPQRLQSILSQIPTPTLSDYKLVLQTWSTSTTEHLFASRTHELFQNIPDPDRECYEIVIRTWGKSTQRINAHESTKVLQQMINAGEGYDPSYESYTIVLRLWYEASVRNDHAAAWRAMGLLELMEGRYRSNESDVKPDFECHKWVLKAWSCNRTAVAADMASKTLEGMVDRKFFLDLECFDAVLETLARSNAKDAASKAGALLSRMEDLYRRGTLPHLELSEYRNGMVAYSKSVDDPLAGSKAMRLLSRLKGKKGPDGLHLMPTPELYGLAIRSWRWSPSMDKIVRARGLLRQMQRQLEQTPSPTAFDAKDITKAYNAFINVCIHTPAKTQSRKRQALLIAIDAMHELKQSSHHHHHHPANPDNHTYKLLFKACLSLLKETTIERTRALQTIFKNCCRDGFLDEEMVMLFRDNVSLETFRRMIAKRNHHRDKTTFPSEWSRNVDVYRKGHEAMIGLDGRLVVRSEEEKVEDKKMRRLRDKTFQKLLRGGRL